eukprot:9102717-Pyramimonas_sp.AAC.1
MSMDLCDPLVTRMARANESLDGCPVFTWSCVMADRGIRSPATGELLVQVGGSDVAAARLAPSRAWS